MNKRYYRGKGEYIFEYMRKFDARDKYTIFINENIFRRRKFGIWNGFVL